MRRSRLLPGIGCQRERPSSSYGGEWMTGFSAPFKTGAFSAEGAIVRFTGVQKCSTNNNTKCRNCRQGDLPYMHEDKGIGKLKYSLHIMSQHHYLQCKFY
jgi:hypothetical protein